MQQWPLTWSGERRGFSGPPECADADFVLFFAERETLGAGEVIASLRSLCPRARLAGCSSGTVIKGEDVLDAAAAAVAVKLERSRVALASVAVGVLSSYDDGQALARQLAAPDLAGVLVFSDGLKVNGSALVAGMQSVLGEHLPIGGGLAGDGPAFVQTLVCADAPACEHVVAALGFYGGALEVRIGAAHGWDDFGPLRRITRSEGVVLYEMDGKPALDLYERYLGEEAADLPASALLYPLLISNPDDRGDEVVRTVLAVDRDARTMTFAGDVPEGWNARLMRGAFDNLSAGAAAAAASARGGGGAGEGLAVLVSCVGRRLLMGQRVADEVEAAAQALGDGFSRIGFYSYGEIATQGRCGLHNQTMTVLTLREAV